MGGAHHFNASALLLLFAITYVASFAKGVTTMGLNLVGVPLIATTFDVKTAVVAMLLPKIMSDAFMALEARENHSLTLLRSISSFAYSGAIAVAVATLALARMPDRALAVILGIGVIVFVALQMVPRAPVIPENRRSVWGILFGSLTGLSQGLTGVGGPTTAMFLYSMALPTGGFVLLSSVIYLALDVCQLAAFVYFGLYDHERLLVSAAFAIPVMLGTWSGVRMRRHLSVRWFRFALLSLLGVTAVTLILRAV